MFCNKEFTLFVFISLLIPALLFGRPNNIYNTSKNKFYFSGSVLDKTNNESLTGVEVFLQNELFGASTDSKGYFLINGIPEGDYTVIIKYLGYKEIDYRLTLHNNIIKDFYLEPGSINLPQVTVEAPKPEFGTGNNSQISLSSIEINKLRGQTLGETLSQLPGVTELQTGPAISKPVIRGLHSQRIIVVNSGVEQEGQQWGAEHAPEIDPFSPSKIAVLKGAASLEYGMGAIGGVINIQPKELPVTGGLGGNLQLNGFSNNMQVAGSLLLEDAISFLPGVAWQFQGSYRKAGDSKTSDYVLGNTGFRELDGNFTLGYTKEQFEIKTFYSHFGTDLGIYIGSHIGNYTDLERAITYGRPPTEYSFTYNIKAPKQSISHDLWSLNMKYNFAGIGQLEATYGWQSNHRQEFDARRRYSDSTTLAPVKAAFDLVLTTYSADIKFKHNPIANNIYGTIGISGMRQLNVGNSLSFLIPNFKAYNGGIYIIENWLVNQFSFNGGIRYDYKWERIYPYAPKNIPDVIKRYDCMTVALGTSCNFSDYFSVSGNFETAWRSPSINELYSNGVHHGTAQYEIGNPLLKSEHSKSIDLSVKYNYKKISLQVSTFYNYINNFIFLFPNPQPTLTLRGLFPTFNYKQANSVLKGFDGQVEYKVFDFYSLGLTFSIVRGDNLETNEPLFQMPADRIRLINHFNIADIYLLRNNYFETGITFTSKQYRYPANVDYLTPPNGYTLFDIELGGEFNVFSGLTAQYNISVKNLFNISYRDYLSRYRYFVDDPGRNIIIRLNIPFGKQS